MKKFIIGILAVCFMIGIPFVVMDALAQVNGNFKLPAGYHKIVVNLEEKARSNEIVFTKEIKNPTEVNFHIQCNSDLQSTIVVASDKKLFGSENKEQTMMINKMIGNSYMSPKIVLMPGKYTIRVTNTRSTGKLVIGYKERTIKTNEFARLLKLDGGDLNNPPEGYEKIYSTDLSGLNCKDITVYTLTLDNVRNVGLSIYTNATKGEYSVDFVGKNSQYYGLIHPNGYSICDRLENILSKGTYEIKLTSNNADGQLYIFLKK